MAKVPARRETKKKPKAASPKPKIESLLDSPPQSVELVKPKRKPRSEKVADDEQ